jgi:hypothetical protein
VVAELFEGGHPETVDLVDDEQLEVCRAAVTVSRRGRVAHAGHAGQGQAGREVGEFLVDDARRGFTDLKMPRHVEMAAGALADLR